MRYKCYGYGAVPELIGASVRHASAFEISNVVGRYDSQPLIGPSFVFSLVYLPVVTARIALHWIINSFGSHADFGDSCTHFYVGHGYPGWGDNH